MIAFAFKEKEPCFYGHETFAHLSNCPVYFSMDCPSAGPEGFSLWRSCSLALRGLQGCPGFWHWVTSGCHRLRGWWKLWPWAGALCTLPSRSLSPAVSFCHLRFVWPLSVLRALAEAIDWLWLLPTDGLQKRNGKINHFSPLGLAEVANTCRTAESAVTCQQTGSWAPSDHFFTSFLLF